MLLDTVFSGMSVAFSVKKKNKWSGHFAMLHNEPFIILFLSVHRLDKIQHLSTALETLERLFKLWDSWLLPPASILHAKLS